MERSNTYEMAGKQKEQEGTAREAVALSTALLAADPGNSRIAVNVAIAQDKLGVALDGKGDAAGAREAFRESAKVLEAIPPGSSDEELKQRFLCLAHYRLARSSNVGADRAESLRRGQAACEAYAALDPSDGSRADGVAQMKALAERALTDGGAGSLSP